MHHAWAEFEDGRPHPIWSGTNEPQLPVRFPSLLLMTNPHLTCFQSLPTGF